MTEEIIDAMKLDYISNRSEKGRKAVEELKAQEDGREEGLDVVSASESEFTIVVSLRNRV
jgi:hypothetical protein